MGNPAPTTYIVKEEGSDETVKVMIGLHQTCSCGGGCIATTPSSNMTTSDESFSLQSSRNVKEKSYGELCIHLIWVMVKALRAAPTHPLVWQLSLIDSGNIQYMYCIYTKQSAE